MDGFILSIDQGTSGTKAIIFNHEGNIVASAFHEVITYYPHLGWVEQDTNEIWTKTLQAVSDVLRDSRLLPEDILAIGISSQRCTSVAWNKNTSEPIGRAILWQDRRTQYICDRISNDNKVANKYEYNVKILPNASFTKILWLMEEDRKFQKALARNELLFGTIDTWLIWKLSGGKTHVTDPSNAFGTGFLNLSTMDFDESVLGKYGINRRILPEIKSSSEIYCHTDPDAFLGVSIPISGCIGDQTAAVFGQACTRPGMVKNTYGTGSFMALNTGEKQIPPRKGTILPVLWSIAGKVNFGLEAYADISGAVVHWLQSGLGIIRDEFDADGLAMQVPDTQGVFFVPAFVGMGATHDSPNARGTLFGMNLGTTKGHITRAAIESIAYQTRESLTFLENAYGQKINSIRVDGGGAKSDFLMQFQADILGIPVERPVVVEASAQGAAYMAGLAIGYWDSPEEVENNWQLETRFEPRMTNSKRDDLYGMWLKAVECARSWGQTESANTVKNKEDEKFQRLSPREKEVVKLIVTGKSMREISAQLYTSQKTVEKQRRDAMRKLEVDSIASLIRLCLEHGWIPDI